MPATYARALHAMVVLLAITGLALAVRGDAQAALPVRRTVTIGDYYFQHVGADEGLEQSGLSALYQDPQGFIWAATPSGLYRYDGRHLLHFAAAAGMPGSINAPIGDIATAGAGRLWLSVISGVTARGGTGLSLFDPQRGQLPLPPGLRAPGSGASLMPLPGNGLLMAGNEGVSLWDGRRLHLLWHAPAAAEGAHALQSCGARTVYALAAGNLLHIDPQRARAQALAMPAPAGGGRALLCGGGRQLLLGTDSGLYAWAGDGTWQKLWPSGAAQTGVRALAQDALGAIWIGPASGGLVRLGRSGAARAIATRHGALGDLPPGIVRRLLAGRDGSLWAIVGAAGLFQTDPRGTRFQSVLVPDRNDPQDRANFIRALAPAPGGSVWVGSHAGLMRYDPDTRELADYTPLLLPALAEAPPPPTLPEAPQLASGQVAVEGIAVEPGGGVLWLASSAGLLRFDVASGRATPAYLEDPGNPVPGQWLFTVWRAPDGTLWLAGAVGGAAWWRPGMAAPHWLPPPRDGGVFPHVFGFAATSGGIWMAANGGLLYWRDGRLERIVHMPGQAGSLASNEVISVTAAADGTLWVGTDEGLDRLVALHDGRARFVHYGLRSGLPDEVIYCIAESPRGRLWVGTNQGIAALDAASGRIVRYGRRDGIRGLEANAGTCTALAGDRVAFGGPQGFTVGSTRPEAAPAPSIPVQLTALRIGENGERVPPRGGTLRIARGEALRIRYASLDFLHPGAALYRHRLLGLEDRWSRPSASRGVVYGDLGGGRYRFEVTRSDAAGRRLGDPATMAVVVVPPWWDSQALRALYAALSGGVLLLLIGMVWSRRRSERAYRRESAAREERLKLALWGSGDALWELDLQRGVLNRVSGSALLGGPHEETLSIEDWRRYAVHPEDLPQVEHALAEHLAGRTPYYESEHRLRAEGGQWIWVRARGKIGACDAAGKPLRVIGTSRDISAELTREREHSIAEMVVRSMGEAVAVTSAQMRFVAVNPAFTRMTGYRAEEIIGLPASVLDSPDQPEASLQVRAQLEAKGHFRGELWQRRRDGEPMLCSIEINEIRDGHGQRTHFVAVLTDVTARRRAEQELHYLANFDPLTGLPNRTLLTERLGEAILRARQIGRLVAVLFVDLDRFKHVNDAHGHSVGDRVLQAAARRLRAVVRDDDTVARLGGDEFTVVLERVAQMQDAEDVARKVLDAFAEPMDLDEGREVQITPSIGIALYPNHGQAPTDLLKYADIAMYRAKERGRNTAMVYTEALDAEVRQRADLIAALQRALKREELHLVYQPKLSLAEDRITGVEALLRWHSEEFGDIPPGLFIPLAEEIGLIGQLGEFVVEKACAELARWRAAGLDDVTMAVNLSVAQLARGEISHYLFRTLARHGLPPQLLELEITESMLMQDPERSRAILEAINNVGVTLAIDDFGTGYSSLAYLQRLPLDTLKIDQTFVSKLTVSPDDETILGTIVLMAHALGLNVVAEGVETQEQIEYLREKDCDEVQGYRIAQPMPGEACLAFIRQHAVRRVAG